MDETSGKVTIGGKALPGTIRLRRVGFYTDAAYRAAIARGMLSLWRARGGMETRSLNGSKADVPGNHRRIASGERDSVPVRIRPRPLRRSVPGCDFRRQFAFLGHERRWLWYRLVRFG